MLLIENWTFFKDHDTREVTLKNLILEMTKKNILTFIFTTKIKLLFQTCKIILDIYKIYNLYNAQIN